MVSLIDHDIVVIPDISFGIVVLVMGPRDRNDDLLHVIELLFC